MKRLQHVGWFQNVYFVVKSSILGLCVTIPRIFHKSITLQYPREKWIPPDTYRGRLHNDIDDCIVCDNCAEICPVDCIHIEKVKMPEGVEMITSVGPKKKFVAPVFDIDMTLCLYCGLCTEVCPTECLTMTKEYEYSQRDYRDLTYHFGEPIPVPPPKAEEPQSPPAESEPQEPDAAASAA